MGTATSIREDVHQSSESPGLPWKLTSIRRTGRDKGLCQHGLLAKGQERAKAKQAMGIVPGRSCRGQGCTCMCFRESPGCTHARPQAHILEHAYVQRYKSRL